MAEGSSSALAVVGLEAVEGGGAAAELQAALQGGLREYRKGNWTLHETVVLIAAKKKDEERRLKGGEKEKSRTAELRWKWIENYCWHNGCHRNQNQCNDKWDNLLRDYKKVRDYEMRLAALPSSAATASASSTAQQAPPPPLSYWQLEKHERKEKGLPSNLLFQVYEALHEVVDKRYPLRGHGATAVPAAAAGNNHQITPPPPPPPPLLLQPPPQLVQQQEVFHAAAQPQPQPQPRPQPEQLLAQQQQQHAGTSTSVLSGKPFATSIPMLPQPTPAHSSAHDLHPSPAPAAEYASESSQSEESEIPASSPAKRRKLSGKAAVERSTSELTQALLACEERKDRRHRDLLSVEEKKLMLENTKTQISRDGIAGLIAAINNLASAVVSLASDKSLGGGGD